MLCDSQIDGNRIHSLLIAGPEPFPVQHYATFLFRLIGQSACYKKYIGTQPS